MISFRKFIEMTQDDLLGHFVLSEAAEKIGVYPTKVGNVTIWIENDFTPAVIAKIKNKIVGKMILYRNQGSHGKNEIFKVVVDEPYRRSGIATLMYKTAEEKFGEIRPSHALSDEAFEFWKKYRPAVFSNDDMRLYQDKLIGKYLNHPTFGQVQIESVASSVVIVKILKGEKAGYTTAMKREEVVSQLGELANL